MGKYTSLLRYQGENCRETYPRGTTLGLRNQEVTVDYNETLPRMMIFG